MHSIQAELRKPAHYLSMHKREQAADLIDKLLSAAPAIAQPVQPVQPAASTWHPTEVAIAALKRFEETCTDNEGYDVPKDTMRNLAAIGLIYRTYGDMYCITDFGNSVLERPIAQPVHPAAAIEARAKDIYATWHGGSGYVPWQDGGNSHMQDRARRMAYEPIDEAIAQPAQPPVDLQHDLRDRLEEYVFWSKLQDFEQDIVLATASGTYNAKSAQPGPPAVSDEDAHEVIVVQPIPTPALLAKADKLASALRGSRVNYSVEQDAAATIWELIDVIRTQPVQPGQTALRLLAVDAMEDALMVLVASGPNFNLGTKEKLRAAIAASRSPDQPIAQPVQPTYPDPTPEMLNGDVLFDAIWGAIKGWDMSRLNDGLYSGPSGNDARHIYDAIKLAQPVPTVATQKSKMLLEHSGCGQGTQVEQITVRINPGDKVMLVMGKYSESIDAALAA